MGSLPQYPAVPLTLEASVFLNWVVNIGTGSWIASYETNCRQNLVALQYMSPSALSCVNQLYGSVALEASRSTGLNALNH